MGRPGGDVWWPQRALHERVATGTFHLINVQYKCRMGNSQVFEHGWLCISLELSPTGLQKLIAQFSGIL